MLQVEKIVVTGEDEYEALLTFNSILARRTTSGTQRGYPKKGEEPITGIIRLDIYERLVFAGDNFNGTEIVSYVTIDT